MRMNPGLDAKDLRLKMEKDVGIWITYVNDMNKKKRLGNVQILLNDVKEGSGAYGYGYV